MHVVRWRSWLRLKLYHFSPSVLLVFINISFAKRSVQTLLLSRCMKRVGSVIFHMLGLAENAIFGGKRWGRAASVFSCLLRHFMEEEAHHWTWDGDEGKAGCGSAGFHEECNNKEVSHHSFVSHSTYQLFTSYTVHTVHSIHSAYTHIIVPLYKVKHS